MDRKTLINNLFDILNTNKIDYFVLRGYLNEDDLYLSKDIDIFVSKKHKNKFTKLLLSNGFKTPTINDNKYPHKQFFIFSELTLVKIDVVFGLYFGKENYKFAGIISFDNDITKFKNFYVLKPKLSFLMFSLHLVFDKNMIISDKNKKRIGEYINLLSAENNFSDYPPLGSLTNYFSSYIKGIEGFTNEKEMLRAELKKSFLKKCTFSKILNLTNKLLNKVLCLRNKIRKRTIAFIGVDGSGKSTAIKRLSDFLGDKCVVQYMGFKDPETKYGIDYFDNNRHISPIRRMKYIHNEMNYRYRKAKKSGRHLILFDRYPWEAFDNSKGKYRIAFWLLFKLFFPKPKAVVYFHCKESTSLDRKNDIEDVNYFNDMKKRFDHKYLKHKFVTIDTDLVSVERSIDAVLDMIFKTGLYELII